jgi:hypothetical protein
MPEPAPEASTNPNRRRDGVAGLIWFVLTALTVFAFAGPDLLPTHDGPHHILSMMVRNHIADPARGYADFVVPGSQTSALGAIAVMGLLEPHVGWIRSHAWLLGGIVGLWSLGGWLLARRLPGPRRWLALLGVATAGQWCLYMGFYSFALGSGLGLVTLWVALAPEPRGRGRLALLSALLLVLAFCHVAAAAFVGWVIALAWVWESGPNARIRALGAAALVGAPAVAVALKTALVAKTIGDAYGATLDMPPWPAELGERLVMLARTFSSGPPWRVILPLVIASIGVAVNLWLAASRRARPRDLALATAAASLACLALLAPINLAGWQFFAPRPVPLATLLAALSLPVERAPRLLRAGLAVILVAFAVSSTAWTRDHNAGLAAAAQPLVGPLQADLVRSGTRLPVIADPIGPRAFDDLEAEVPFAQPFLNVGLLFVAAEGGMAPYFFANLPQAHPYVFKASLAELFAPVPPRDYWRVLRDPATPEDDLRKVALRSVIAAYAAHFGDAIVWGSEADARAFADRGFVADLRAPGLLVGSFRGCPLRVEVEEPAGADASRPLRAELGWYPATPVAWAGPIERSPPVALDGSGVDAMTRSTLTPPLTPCGPVWLRIFRDEDRSGDFTPGDATCHGVGGSGRAVLELPLANAPARCRLP